MHYPPGTIGILSGNDSCGTAFAQALRAMTFPEGSQILWCESLWIAGAVNEIIAGMQPESEWLTVIADDHEWDPDLFFRLLDHRLPLVSPLVHLRRYPFPPSLFHALPDGNYQCYEWDELTGKTGLLAVDTFGGPCSIIHRSVLEALGEPWFQNQPGQRVYPHEDLYFFNRARLAGFQPYVDLDTSIWHCFAAKGRPERQADGRYGIRVAAHGELGVLEPVRQQVNAGRTHHSYT